MRIVISMPERFLEQIDSFAEKQQRNRSELIREALRTYINRQNLQDRYMTNPIDKSLLRD